MESELKIHYLDRQTNELIETKDLKDQIDKLKKFLEYALNKMRTLQAESYTKYELADLKAKFGIEAGFWILKAEGEIEFTWKKKQ